MLRHDLDAMNGRLEVDLHDSPEAELPQAHPPVPPAGDDPWAPVELADRDRRHLIVVAGEWLADRRPAVELPHAHGSFTVAGDDHRTPVELADRDRRHLILVAGEWLADRRPAVELPHAYRPVTVAGDDHWAPVELADRDRREVEAGDDGVAAQGPAVEFPKPT